MYRCPFLIVLCLTFSLFFPLSVQAARIATESATVTATVPVIYFPAGPDTIAPSAPILIRPFDGWTTSDTTPEFVWRQSSDPNGNFVAYTFYLDGVTKYLGISNVGNSAGTGYTSEIDATEVRLIPTSPIPQGIHTWKIAAYDYSGNLTYSTQWTLIIDNTPAPLTITDLDIYHNLHLSSLDPSSIPPGTSFTVTGPKDIYFTFVTDPYTTVSLTFISAQDTVIGPTRGTTGNYSTLSLYRHLEPGSYTVQAFATDPANLVTLLPDFTLNVNQPVIELPIPGFPSAIKVPSQLVEISSLLYNYPATVARITARPSLAAIYVLSIALIIIMLLIYLKKRYNLQLIGQFDSPIPRAEVRLPQLDRIYSLNNRRGRIYIPALNRHTELAIEVNGVTTGLCLLHSRRVYTIPL